MQRNALIATSVLVIVIIIAAAGSAVYISGQRGTTVTVTSGESGSKLKVLASFYPLADFAQNVGGDKVNVSLLVPPTTDVHEFEPTPSSVQQVSTANLLIINGFGLEPWEPQIVASADNSKLVVVNCSQGITPIKVPPEFQSNNRTIDPHIWLDPVLVKTIVKNILQGLIQADPSDSAYFTANAQSYDSKLDFLNSQIINATRGTLTRNFVTFHTAFGYFAQTYNLTMVPVFGPFEEEPTAQDIQNVVSAIHQYHLCYVGYESLENPAIPQSIASQTNASLILMDPIEGITPQQQALGMDYISLMQMDLLNIATALNHVGCS
jgi:zinc transport system substrate-binding protein